MTEGRSGSAPSSMDVGFREDLSLIRMSAGNFRLLSRLLTPIERILKVNEFATVAKEVVAAARDSLVIGQG